MSHITRFYLNYLAGKKNVEGNGGRMWRLTQDRCVGWVSAAALEARAAAPSSVALVRRSLRRLIWICRLFSSLWICHLFSFTGYTSFSSFGYIIFFVLYLLLDIPLLFLWISYLYWIYQLYFSFFRYAPFSYFTVTLSKCILSWGSSYSIWTHLVQISYFIWTYIVLIGYLV